MKSLEDDQLNGLVTTNLGILRGTPVFTGTRVPIEFVLGSLDTGMTMDEVRHAYPFVTNTHVQAARQYRATHPEAFEHRSHLSDLLGKEERFSKEAGWKKVED